MDVLDIILIVLSLIVFYFVYEKIKGNRVEIKSAEEKKSEIIKSFERRMIKTLQAHQHNKEQQRFEKTKLLKQISSELSTNIYFDEQEVKQIIQKLANMHI